MANKGLWFIYLLSYEGYQQILNVLVGHCGQVTIATRRTKLSSFLPRRIASD